MNKMVTVMYAQFQGYGATECGTPLNPQNDGKMLFLNLLDRDELIGIAATAFRKAYHVWDGDRQFKPLFRTTYVNIVRDVARKERLHRLREPTMSLWNTQDEGFNPLHLIMDQRVHMIPVEACDFNDFVESLTGVHRILVSAVLDAPTKLNIKKDATPKAILGALRRYSASIVGLTLRQYWAAYYEIGELLRERAITTAHRSRTWHVRSVELSR